MTATQLLFERDTRYNFYKMHVRRFDMRKYYTKLVIRYSLLLFVSIIAFILSSAITLRYYFSFDTVYYLYRDRSNEDKITELLGDKYNTTDGKLQYIAAETSYGNGGWTLYVKYRGKERDYYSIDSEANVLKDYIEENGIEGGRRIEFSKYTILASILLIIVCTVKVVNYGKMERDCLQFDDEDDEQLYQQMQNAITTAFVESLEREQERYRLFIESSSRNFR